MKSFLSFIFLFLSLSVWSQSSKEEQIVWSRVEALSKAIFETKDSSVLKDLVSSRVTYGHSGGSLEDKAEMVHKASMSPTVYKNSLLERMSIDIQEKTAIVRHTFRAISVEKGTETPLNLGILQVWKKENGKWRLWARQAVKIPPKT